MKVLRGLRLLVIVFQEVFVAIADDLHFRDKVSLAIDTVFSLRRRRSSNFTLLLFLLRLAHQEPSFFGLSDELLLQLPENQCVEIQFRYVCPNQ